MFITRSEVSTTTLSGTEMQKLINKMRLDKMIGRKFKNLLDTGIMQIC